MKIIQLITISFVLSVINSVNHITFLLERGEELCLSEYFSDKTLVIYTLNSLHNIEVKITDPDERVKFSKV